MLQKSIRNTYRSIRSNRNFEGRKNRAIAKARIIKSTTDETQATKDDQSQQDGCTGCRKTGCVFFLGFFGFIPGLHLYLESHVLFSVLWVVLMEGLLIAWYLMISYYLKIGRLTEKREFGIGCGFGSLIGSVMFGLAALGFLLSYSADNGLEIVYGIPSIIFLIIGILIISFIHRKIKK